MVYLDTLLIRRNNIFFIMLRPFFYFHMNDNCIPLHNQFIFFKNIFMIRFIFSLLLLLSIVSCTKNLNDENYISKERLSLGELLKEEKVVFYKGIKILSRINLANRSSKEVKFEGNFPPEKSGNMLKIAQRVAGKSTQQEQSIIGDAKEYYFAYKEYNELKDRITAMDEDSLPTFMELYLNAPNSYDSPEEELLLKYYGHSVEHLMFALALYTPQKLPKSLVLYEMSKIHMELLGLTDIRTVTQAINGMCLMEYEMPYLADIEFTNNLSIVDDPNFMVLVVSPVVPSNKVTSLTKTERVKLEQHAVNLVGRGLARMSMDREDKKELAMQDFESFLVDAEKLGWDNELTWATTAYLCLLKGDNENAIIALKKLNNSSFSSPETKEVIDQTITYLEAKENVKAFSSFSDKVFIAKLTFNVIVHGMERAGLFDKFLNNDGGKEIVLYKQRLENESNSLMKVFQLDDLKESDLSKSVEGFLK